MIIPFILTVTFMIFTFLSVAVKIYKDTDKRNEAIKKFLDTVLDYYENGTEDEIGLLYWRLATDEDNTNRLIFRDFIIAFSNDFNDNKEVVKLEIFGKDTYIINED